jgi:hypothetical protein
LFFTWGKVEKVKNEGKPNEYRFKKNGFTRIGFTTAPKHIDALTDELVDDAQFDANWYTVPTKEELEAFYVENFSSQASMNDDIPMDIPMAKPVATPKAAPKPVVVEEDIPDPVAKDVTEDADDISAPAPKATPAKKVEAAPKAAPEDINDINSTIEEIMAQYGVGGK